MNSSCPCSRYSAPQRIFIAICLLLALCSIAVFIWMLVDASRAGSARGILFVSAVLLASVGSLVYIIMKPVSARRASVALWVSIPIAVAAAVVALFVQGGASQPNIDQEEAEIRLEQTEAQGN